MRKKIKRRLKLAGMILGVLAAAFLCFAGFFYVSDIHVTVVGSTRYTDQEIREMVFQNFADRNSLYLAFVKKSLDPGQAFIKSITVEYENHNSLRLHVNEDAPVGFIRQDTFDYYFDSEGVVLEALPSGTQSGGTGTESTESVGTAATSTSGTDTSGALQAVTERGSDTQFRPALADVVEVTGLTEEPLKAGQTISVTDSGIFSTLQAVTRLFNKFDIKPDSISVDSGNSITLHYGTVDVCLGKDTLLEEKMARADAILPQLKGLSGTLHLENYSEDTVNIIFDKAGTDSSSSAGESGTDSSSGGSNGTGTVGTSGTDAGSTGTEDTGTQDTYPADTDTSGTDSQGTGISGTGADQYGDGTDTYGTGTYGNDGSDTYGEGTYGTEPYGTDAYGDDSGTYGY
jgi:cell division protein FtsQ